MTSGPSTLLQLAHDALDSAMPWQLVTPDQPASEATAIDALVITGVTLASAQVGPGSLFACVPGRRVDGHDLAPSVVEAGAAALVTMRPLGVPVPQIVVKDPRRAVALLAAAFFGWPSRQLSLTGITGTNGKTSTAQLLNGVLNAVGRTSAVRGTLEGTLTTPEAPEFQAWLAQCRDGGLHSAVVEVSSHALELERVTGTWFEVGVFTNLGRDHLDFHGTPERYFAAKAKLFEAQRCGLAVVNRDDVHGRLLSDTVDIPVVGFSADDVEELCVDRFRLSYRWRGHGVQVPLGGRFHMMNSLAALTAASALGVDEAEAVAALATVPAVRGRFEVIEVADAPTVVVDFAHTPDALHEVLSTARSLVGAGRVFVVFGCGGDRDVPKRPLMGATAARLADGVILTCDNPRSEDPQHIIDAIVAGVNDVDAGRLVAVEVDRRAAISLALNAAAPGDVVVVAGKGHETTQIVGDVALPFDDADVVRQLLGVSP
jgi:UDP-N-acetylmuramoyl-L-alanyl-D-glutamate--2,6-diaminopimelate ligase